MPIDELGLVERLNEEAERLSGHSLDHGSVDAGIASNLASEAAAAIERLLAERDGARAETENERLHNAELFSRAFAAEALLEVATFSPWLREWCRRRFGKWITHNTAKGALNDLRARQALQDSKP